MLKWCFLIAFYPFVVIAQSESREEIYISVKQKSGFLAAHRGVMGHLPKEPALGGEISLYKRLGGNQSWHKPYNYPYAGMTFYGSTVGNNAILGKAFGIYGFIEFPITNGRNHRLTGKLGTGLGLITKVFNQETNPKDVAMSTYLNALICIGIQGHIRLAERHELLYSLDMTHMSNGAFQVPNLGINMPYIGLGYACKIKEKEVLQFRPQNEVLVLPKRTFFENWKLHVLGVVSAKEVFPTGGKKYPVYQLSLMGRKLFRTKVGMETSLDLISKQAVFGYKRYIPKTQWSIMQIGVYVGYVLPLDRLQFVLGMGTYLKDRYDPDGHFYHRIGMRYQFDNGITANVVLKSHWAKADYVEWGIGYTFKHRVK